MRLIGFAMVASLTMTSPVASSPVAPIQVVWRTQVNGADNGDDHATSVVIDAAGDVIAGGDMVNEPEGFQNDFTVIKTSGATGGLIWQVSLPGTGNVDGAGVEQLALDGNGDVIAAGEMDNSGSNLDFAVVKLSGATGQVVWSTQLRGTGSGRWDSALAVVVNAAGDVFAGGFVDNLVVFRTFIVVKLNGVTGAVLWRRELNGSASAFRTQVNALALDAGGDVVAAGSIVNSGRAEDFAVVKLDGGSGAVIWRVELNGTGSYQDEAYDVAIDSTGKILVAGFIYGADTFQDVAVVKLEEATGSVVWQRTINGAANWVDTAYSLALDSRGDVVVGGNVYNRNDVWTDFTVAKIAGATGRLLWRRNIAGTASSGVRDVEVDPTGQVVAAGEISRGDRKTEFTVVLLDNTTGRRVGTVELNGTDNWFDIADDVAVGAGGRIVSAGHFVNRGTGADFAIVRIR